MISRRASRLLALLPVAGLVLMGCSTGSSGTGSDSKSYTMRLTTNTTANDPYGVAMQRIANQISKQSGGRIKTSTYYNSDLGTSQAQLQQTIDGSVQFVYSAPGNLTSFVPDLSILYLPFLFPNVQDVYAMEDGPIGKELDAAIQAKTGLKVLGWSEVGFKNLITKSKPVSTISDIHGMKIRTGSTTVEENTITALGATPVPLDFSEVVPDFSTGTINGYSSDDGSYLSEKVDSVAKYDSEVQYFYEYEPEMVNAKWFDALPPDLQKIVTTAAIDGQNWERKDAVQEDDQAENTLRSQGVTIVTPTPAALAAMKAATKSVYTAEEATLSAQGKKWLQQLEQLTQS